MRGFLRRNALLLVLGAFGATALSSQGFAEQGVYDDRILFGQSAAFKGPAAALGNGMREGIICPCLLDQRDRAVLAPGATDRDGSGRTIPRTLHGRGFPAGPAARKRNQRAGVL